jgi:hypothetical protein
MFAPGLVGFDMLYYCSQHTALPVVGHPAFLGSYTDRGRGGFECGCIFGQLPRLAGADIMVFPNFGGRFSLSEEQCAGIRRMAQEDLGPIQRMIPCPAGGMKVKKVGMMRKFYSDDVALLIGGSLDFATPPQTATRDLLPHLPNGRQVVLANLGHTDDFWAYEPAASERLVNTFFDNGRVDTSLYTPSSVDFTPSTSQGTIAKITLGTMLGLAALTVLSLLWMPLRIHRRGAFGPKASAFSRSLYAAVLGLGGLFLGALVVLTAFPTVPLTDDDP